ncbi:hypothetical protein ACFL08_01630 [Patescibacteria group bacterium]
MRTVTITVNGKTININPSVIDAMRREEENRNCPACDKRRHSNYVTCANCASTYPGIQDEIKKLVREVPQEVFSRAITLARQAVTAGVPTKDPDQKSALAHAIRTEILLEHDGPFHIGSFFAAIAVAKKPVKRDSFDLAVEAMVAAIEEGGVNSVTLEEVGRKSAPRLSDKAIYAAKLRACDQTQAKLSDMDFEEARNFLLINSDIISFEEMVHVIEKRNLGFSIQMSEKKVHAIVLSVRDEIGLNKIVAQVTRNHQEPLSPTLLETAHAPKVPGNGKRIKRAARKKRHKLDQQRIEKMRDSGFIA